MMVLVAAWYRLGMTRPSTISATRAAFGGGATVRLIMPLGDGFGPISTGGDVGAGGPEVISS